MSDRSSESSCEWVVLNEDDEEIALDDNEQSLNLELQYDAICHAVSDSIRSSLSSEELEWQYEQYEDYIPPQRAFVQEVNIRDFDDTEDCHSEDSNVEDEVVNKCVSTSDIEEEDNVNIASLSKIHSYKHNRNDHLNFILNFTLALVLASAVGLGIGHFLGWSHKCFKTTSVIPKAADNIVELPHLTIIDQENEVNEHQTKKGKSFPQLSENSLNSVTCTDFKGEDSSTRHDIGCTSVDSNIPINSNLAETSISMTSDVLEFKTEEEFSLNNSSKPYVLSFTPESDISTKVNWNEFSDFEAVAKKIHGLKEVSSSNTDTDMLIEEEVHNIELDFFASKNVKEKISDRNDVVYNAESLFSVNENDNILPKSNLNKNEFEFLKEYFNVERNPDNNNNFTSQLKKDLNEVVESLAAITLARLSDVNGKYSSSFEEPELIIKLFSDFQTLINSKITEIDNFVNSIEHKDSPKFNVKYFQKMVYTVVDSVDYLMKVSFKTLNRDARKINIHKFSSNISKVIFNFNKKWDKNSRFWPESSKKFKVKNFQNSYHKKEKENKYSKNKAQFEKYNKKTFKYRNTMKS